MSSVRFQNERRALRVLISVHEHRKLVDTIDGLLLSPNPGDLPFEQVIFYCMQNRESYTQYDELPDTSINNVDQSMFNIC